MHIYIDIKCIHNHANFPSEFNLEHIHCFWTSGSQKLNYSTMILKAKETAVAGTNLILRHAHPSMKPTGPAAHLGVCRRPSRSAQPRTCVWKAQAQPSSFLCVQRAQPGQLLYGRLKQSGSSITPLFGDSPKAPSFSALFLVL